VKTGWRSNTSTPDGQQICFNYQKYKGCLGGCNRTHVCQKCFGNHPVFSCDQW